MATAARASADVGLIGLVVIGENLALNMADHGYRVTVYNRTTAVLAPPSRLPRPRTPGIGIVVLVDTQREPPASQGTPASMSATRPTAAAAVLRAS